ncbi:SDR family NAD(P)-dependent oxidoreductase [Halopseudomonas bauzanensis]|uniref:NAD(P)-dependent dehydrogenase, short-chain alcohol dehydrogenase family n=1 Tax=Halopseudomonas bauzanensis TaxID=653930 RepID=A0A1I4MRW7_9GAMM|nr:SDR family oxidoreductase [Halopseudomonas bauzanensis]SES05131.1 NAD(P)-dependent dehydrogenase, short-chain alcohol dehydrogenase family [Halopseudomonas bauzanensis]SFM05753.1 NAD(P)-dependent dehydrogenase, short-chain alcohol dehydrogenase family [Halopseudomonas bauzanensis]
MTTDKLKDRVAIITGAGGGLGAECARVLASHGAAVAIVDINQEAAESVAAEIESVGGQAIALRTDVSSEDDVKAMVEQVMSRFGRIDVLYNNAAVLDVGQRQKDRDICNLDMDAFDCAVAVNLRGAVLCSKHVIPVMLKQGKGSVIFATSGLGAQGDLSLTGYATTKAALNMLPKLVAAQYGKLGVRGNAVQIGLAPAENAHSSMPPELLSILRDNHLTPELGTPRQIADVVAFLACDESSFVTGTTLVADGGFGSHTPSLVAMRAFFEQSEGRTGM